MTEFITTFLTIASLHLLGLISPGPDFILVTKNALLYQRSVALLTAAGIAVGIGIHVSYCVLGLAILIVHSTVAITVIQYLGGAYLAYIGAKACFSRSKSFSSGHVASASVPLSSARAFWQGFFCNVLNPKAGLFILGLFTLAIKPSVPLWAQWVYGSWIVVSTFFYFAVISLVITHQAVRQRLLSIQPKITLVMGILLIIFGLELIIWRGH